MIEIKANVKTLAEKPGKPGGGMVDKILFCVAAALVGFLLAKIGL